MGSGGSPFALRPMRPTIAAQAGWRGMRDSENRSQHPPHLAYAMENVYPRDIEGGDAIVGRPGFLLTNTATGVLGTEVQNIGHISQLDGTEITYAVVDGEIYTYDWSADAWTRVVTAANLGTGSVTLATTGRVYSVSFVDTVVFSDGTNKPFTWDGTSGAGGLTPLTNAPVAYGQPVVYYAKLFFIKSTARSDIVWSEENQPNTGYEAGGFNNAWTLGQTDQDEIVALVPTNEALYYLRQFSIGAIWGAVTPDFQTTGTQEAVSSSVGTASPAGWSIVGNTIYFTDSLARIQSITIGGGLKEPGPWHDARVLLGLSTLSRLEAAESVFAPDLNIVLCGHPTSNTATMERFVTVQPDAGVVAGVFSGFALGGGVQVLAEVKDTSENIRIMYGTADGYVFVLGLASGSDWSDRDTANEKVAIPHVFESAPFFYGVRDTKVLDRIDVELLSAGLTGIVPKVRTERGLTAPGLSWDDPNTSGTLWDTALWDNGLWDGGEEHAIAARFGVDNYGRWFQVRIEHEEEDETFGLLAIMAEAFTEGPDVDWP